MSVLSSCWDNPTHSRDTSAEAEDPVRFTTEEAGKKDVYDSG